MPPDFISEFTPMPSATGGDEQFLFPPHAQLQLSQHRD
jgi:hypothetical protein